VEKKRFNGRELREHPRKKCSIPIKFAMQNKIHQGEIKDISLGGIFLKTANNVKVGQRLRLAIPIRKKGKVIKRSGKIVWSNKVGVGIKFQQTAGK
jgi:Tfp pilus assembly protein PilZ